MASDPNLPIEFTLADAAQMRSQFNALFDLIQTNTVGPQGRGWHCRRPSSR